MPSHLSLWLATIGLWLAIASSVQAQHHAKNESGTGQYCLVWVETVRVEGHANVPRVTPEKPYATPEGMTLWQAKRGKTLMIPGDVGGE